MPHKKKVLIADDQKEYASSLKNVFGDKFEVDLAYNSDDAIKLIGKNKYDLIITDNNMEDGYESSGLHLIEGRAKTKNKDTYTILSSSMIPDEVKEKVKKIKNTEMCKKYEIFERLKKEIK